MVPLRRSRRGQGCLPQPHKAQLLIKRAASGTKRRAGPHPKRAHALLNLCAKDFDARQNLLVVGFAGELALTVLEIGALADLDDVAVRIANVAANLAILGDRLGDELGSAAFPQFVARLNIRNAEIHKAIDVIGVGDAERYRRLIRSRPTADVQNHPYIRKLKVRRRVAVAQAQNARAENLFVIASGPLDVGDGEKMRDADPLARRHLIAFLVDLYGTHW